MHLCPWCGAGCDCFDVEEGAALEECLHDCAPIDPEDDEQFSDDDAPEAQAWGEDAEAEEEGDDEC